MCRFSSLLEGRSMLQIGHRMAVPASRLFATVCERTNPETDQRSHHRG